MHIWLFKGVVSKELYLLLFSVPLTPAGVYVLQDTFPVIALLRLSTMLLLEYTSKPQFSALTDVGTSNSVGIFIF